VHGGVEEERFTVLVRLQLLSTADSIAVGDGHSALAAVVVDVAAAAPFICAFSAFARSAPCGLSITVCPSFL